MSLMKRNGGFTLVELIVVIAILAILAGVGVPAYSGYVDKANKGADQTLIRDVAHALTLYYYSNSETVTSANVVLGQGEPSADEAGDAAMKAVFGDNWKETVRLQYADWNGDTSAAAQYAASSYYGKENSLLDQVNSLTDALGMAVEGGLKLGNFETFLAGYGMNGNSDSTAISNAAVLYVAQQTADNQAFIQSTIASKLSSEHFINETFTALSPTIGDAAALATIYAYAEGFAQYCDKKDANVDAVNTFHSSVDFSVSEGQTMDATLALGRLETAFNALGTAGRAYVSEYMAAGGPSLDDMAGYVSIMGTVNDNKNIVEGNLSNNECFTDGTVENLLKGYAEMGGITAGAGQVAVALVNVDGVVGTHVSPMNWNK